MKNLTKYITRLALCLGLSVVFCCDRMDTEYESFSTKGEITYPGVGTNFSYRPGRLRTALVWNPSADPSITRYVVYYNNKADSVTVAASLHDPSQEVEVVVPDLLEYVYSFTIYAIDAKGNRSIPQEVSNVKVYGEFYEGSLLNRPYDTGSPYELYDDGKVELNFITADTINVGTQVKYTNTADEEVEVSIDGDVSILTLDDYKMGTPVLYRSSYIPEHTAIDDFWVTHYDTFPTIKPYTYVLINKSLWKENPLANDVGTYEGQTSVSKLWDGSDGPQGYPNIFHSNTMDLPQVLTFDLGEKYLLSHIEETGRNCCHNPDRFQVWGIDHLQGAATALPSTDPGWEDEAIVRGWKLLGEVNRSDDGSTPYKVELNHRPPAVQYIRIRILHTANNNTNTSNMSEITFWKRMY
jgi:hypothetical protein